MRIVCTLYVVVDYDLQSSSKDPPSNTGRSRKLLLALSMREESFKDTSASFCLANRFFCSPNIRKIFQQLDFQKQITENSSPNPQNPEPPHRCLSLALPNTKKSVRYTSTIYVEARRYCRVWGWVGGMAHHDQFCVSYCSCGWLTWPISMIV